MISASARRSISVTRLVGLPLKAIWRRFPNSVPRSAPARLAVSSATCWSRSFMVGLNFQATTRGALTARRPGDFLNGMPPKPVPRSILLVVSGVCQGSQGPGGGGYVACFPTGLERQGQGAADETTANRMEITATIEGFQSLGGKDRGMPVGRIEAAQA